MRDDELPGDTDSLSPGERIAVWLAVNAPELREPYRLGQELAEWADGQAKDRVTDALVWAAWTVAHSPGIKHQAKAVNEILNRAGTLATDRTKP